MNFLSVIAASRRRRTASTVIAEAALWMDSSDASTVLNSSFAEATNGQAVARWVSKIGSHQFNQTDNNFRPILNTTGGRRITFDGSNDFLAGAASTLPLFNAKPGCTIISVYKWTANPTTTRSVVAIAGNNTTRANLYAGATSRKLGLGGRRLDANSFVGVNSAADNPTANFIHTGIIDWANSNLFQYINGSLDGTTTSFQTDGNSDSTDSTSFILGANIVGNAQFANIDMLETIIWATALSAADRQLVEAALTSKWAI